MSHPFVQTPGEAMLQNQLIFTTFVCCAALSADSAQAGKKSSSLIRLHTRHGDYEGKAVAKDKDYLWLMNRDGRMTTLSFGEVESFEKVSPNFKGFSTVEMRDELKREYKGKLEVIAKGSYVVCAPRGRAREYAALFDQIYTSFRSYFRRRNLKLSKPEFPLVALVFPDHVDFATYARREKVRASRGLMGYYHPNSNRVALFDPGQQTAAREVQPLLESQFALLEQPRETFALLTTEPYARASSSSSGLQDTMIHEATHQMAFNTGLHSRIGQNPKWVVEGLATVFEAPGIRGSGSKHNAITRINRERFVRFNNYAQQRRQKKSLEAFVADDSLFNRAVLDAYAEAWALSFYLIETRSSAYLKYLRKIAKRDPVKAYRSKERVHDFKQAFGKDLAVLEGSMLRYFEKLARTID